ncbi:MAG: methionine adenosyltransferase [Firmicutes bacterium]|nr:methionine adenosyltransferase [Bacillota bacterium]
MKRFFTSESVTEGHPDKICDSVADSILDAVLAQDSNARVACEVVVTTDFMLIMGEISTTATVDYAQVARDRIREIGYNNNDLGFNCDTLEIQVKLHTQSPDIAMGITQGNNIGAGDQGMMFGYACVENKQYMPLSLSLAHELARQLTKVRKNDTLSYLRPDGKTQVTVEYSFGKPKRVDTVILSAQHDKNVKQDDLKRDIKKFVIEPILGNWIDNDSKILINTTGQFIIGGPHGDSGLTGRKLIVDTYGGHCAHGGGAFSGKDCTKVDRSAAYMARYICKNLVAAGVALKCELQISYAIGVSQPISVYCNSFGTGKLSDKVIGDLVLQLFDLSPQAIIQKLDLRKPIYAQTAVYGHFGIENVPWERLDCVDLIRRTMPYA